MTRRSTNEEFINKAILKHGNNYNYDKVVYKDARTNIEILCNTCKNTFKQTPTNHLSGKGCVFCKIENRKLTQEEFIEKSISVHGNKYNYNNAVYTSSNNKVEICCNTCNNTFEQIASIHLQGHGCPMCARNKKSSTNEFINKSILIHKDKYNYNNVNYIDNATKVEILCNQCNNTFEQTPNNHLIGQGCNICGIERTKTTLENFIRKSIKIHNNKYNYDNVVYVNNYTKVEIFCNTCKKLFSQLPNNHLSGQHGCPMCARKNGRQTLDDFIKKSIIIHNNKYNYDNVIYTNSTTKVEILCNQCNNTFLQRPNSHLSGSGCSCNKKGIYNDRYFEKYPEKINIPGKIYLNKFINLITNEIFYKIGITTWERHFGSVYKVTSVKEIETTLYEAYLKEKYLLNKFKNLQYIPQLKFDGRKECFTELLIQEEEIKNLFNL